ncbi:transcriptional regulator [Bosea sp. 2KB_26]|uniref:transcriptional regulator n=1 Tax=Bosea sp. 2KB_26 TaxID=3237475 RepID=UPI003F9048E9
MSNSALKRAIEAADGPVALSRALGISSQAIPQWKRVPAARVLQVESITGVSRHDLRPDIFGAKPDDRAA